MSLTLTILGCGSSGGVPRIGNNWGQCDPQEPKNRRRRCSLLVEKREGDALTRVLVDTTPDLVSQLNSADAGTLDGVWYTHEHADHTHGIDDLRQVAINMRERVNVWADHSTAEMLMSRFSYCFLTPPGSSYPPILEMNTINAGQHVSTVGSAGAITAMPFSVNHGDIDALGFRWGNVASTPDVKNIPADVTHHLEGLDIWIIDAYGVRRIQATSTLMMRWAGSSAWHHAVPFSPTCTSIWISKAFAMSCPTVLNQLTMVW